MDQSLIVFIIGCMLASLPSIGSDIFTPSINSMAVFLNSSIDGIQFSMSALMLGITLSQLVYGPVSEGVGRKPVLFFGLIVAIAGAYTCTIARDLDTLLLGQAILGIGLGCGSLFRCIFSDCYTGQQLRKRGAYASLFYNTMVTGAPLLGGYLEDFFYWQACFAVIAILSIITMLMILFFMPETNKHHSRERLSPAFIFRVYNLVLSHQPFRCYCLCAMLTMAGFFSWMIVMPVFFVTFLKWSPVEYAWSISMICLFAMAVGGLLNNYILHRFSMHTVFQYCWACMLLASVILAGSYAVVGMNADWLIFSMLVFITPTAFLWPSYFTQAFAPFHEQSGYANAIYGSMQILGSSLAAFILAYAPDNTPYPLAGVLFITTAICWAYYRLVVLRYDAKDN